MRRGGDSAITWSCEPKCFILGGGRASELAPQQADECLVIERLCFMRTTQTGSRGIRPAQSLSHDAQALPCEWEYLVPAVTTHDDGRATDVDVHSWMSHQKQLDDRQRPSATIGNNHRQLP